MKLAALFIVFTLFSNFAFANGGNVLICSSEDNEVKMTADLSDGKDPKVAKATLEGIPALFPELKNGKKQFKFDFYVEKTKPLTVLPLNSKVPVITVTTDPAKNGFQVIHETTEPSPLKISKYKAILSVPKLEISNQEVSCTETRWKE